MKPSRLVSIVLLLSILISLCVGLISGPAQAESLNQAYTNTITTARNEMWKAMASSKAANASITIIDNGVIVYNEGFGMANREQSLPVTQDTLFDVGSVSKMFTATAIMQLVDDHKVGLDNKVTEYIPEFTMADPRYKDITVRMLLNHASGLPGTAYSNVTGYGFFAGYQQFILDLLKSAHLKAAPGELSPYCNDGFTLAEIVVERASGKKYIDFVRERIFQPLGMTHAGPSVAEQPGQSVARHYDPTSGKLMPVEYVSIKGAGGLAMTTDDLARFGYSFSGQGPQILSAAALAEMLKAQPSLFSQSFDPNIFVTGGLGWDFTDHPTFHSQGIQLLAKSGGTSHYGSFVITVPSQRVSVAIIASDPGTSVYSVALDVAKALLVEKGMMRDEPAAASKPVAPQPLPQVLFDKQGLWLTNAGLVKITGNRQTNQVTISSINSADGSETFLKTLTYNNGVFSDQSGLHLYMKELAGKVYLYAADSGDVYYQKFDVPLNNAQLRIDVQGKTWLRRNAKAYENETYNVTYVLHSNLVAGLPGYVDFGGIKKIETPDYASFASTGFRDQMELYLFDKAGATWARLYDLVFSPESAAKALVSGSNSVTMGSEGYNEWLTVGTGSVLSFQIPTSGRVIVLSPDDTMLYCSSIDNGEMYAPAGSRVELAGNPGDNFTVTAR